MRVQHIESLIDDQTALATFISTAYEKVISVGDDNITSHRIQIRESALKEAWVKFSTNHDTINHAIRKLRSHDQAKLHYNAYFKKEIYQATQEAYLQAVESVSALTERIQQIKQRASSSQSQSSGIQVTPGYVPRLPQLDLPHFDGTLSDWLPYKDLFESMIVSNVNLSAVLKLNYLKQSLKGTAAHLLKNTALVADNFQKAWEALVSFYENKRLLVNSALHMLMTLKQMNKESASELENLYATVTQIYRTLETLGRPVQTWDDILVFITVQRLDSESVRAWEQHLGSSREPPTWVQLIGFLMTRLLTLQAVEKSRKPSSVSKQYPIKVHYSSTHQENPVKCMICSADHYTARCPNYVNQTVQRRLEIIKKHKLCYNCLGSHLLANCPSTRRCIKCAKRHHTSIHKTELPGNLSTDTSHKAQANFASSHPISTAPQMTLATAQVFIQSDKGEKLKIRALIDPGSQISFISEKVVQQLHLLRQSSSIPLHGIGAVNAGRTRGLVVVMLHPHFQSDHKCIIIAHILPKLTSNISAPRPTNLHWPHLKGLILADPDSNSVHNIDLIIGADYYGQILQDGLRKGPAESPTAQRTSFGWVLFGPSTSLSFNRAPIYHVSVDDELNDLLQKFWKLEELPTSSKSMLSAADQECEDHFKSNYSRDNSGRYIVRLPFKKSVDSLANSKTTAQRMLDRLQKKLQSDPPLKKAYVEFLKEYETLNHMKLVPEAIPEPSSVYYLPHHGIIRANSLTTRLRVVFNASSRTSSGLSLNDILHTGTKLQTELINVLIHFRQFLHVFLADVEKMYRQIQVHKDDWNFQRIIWRLDDNQEVTYTLTTVTYGLVCAPFLALRVMSQLIQDEGDQYPEAIETLTKGRYVDDIFGGADSLTQAQEIVNQVNNLCMAGGFPLQKWISNNPAILTSIHDDKQLFSNTVPIDRDALVHTLGMNWNPTSDTFHFTWTNPATNKLTKRGVLSVIARLFDPLGLISPVTISAKILVQEMWCLKLDWDDNLPIQSSEKWVKFMKHLQDLHLISFPRWMGLTSGSTLEIHGFCDASQLAMAAVGYIRATDQGGLVRTALICSKTKVAPLKRLTIPRLELAAAVLLTKLIHHILQTFNNNKQITIHLWTDSAVTYTWINNHSSRWKDFVHNRVVFIQETLSTSKWHFIPGKENPADCATRGLTPSQLALHSIWWTGPEWLQLPSSSWPNKITSISNYEDLEERPIQATTVITGKSSQGWELLHRYSSLMKLLRITSLCRRFIRRLKNQAKSLKDNPITVQELEEAKHYWIKVTQAEFFSKEIKLLTKGEVLPANHYLVRLTPFIDNQGFLRLGGRLQASSLPLDSKHPFIIPKTSPLTQLIIANAHQRTLHGGTSATAAFLKTEFWVLGGRVPISSFINKCVKCVRFLQKRAQQLMGQLPSNRVNPSRPFLHSGVDYAGPLVLKTWRGRTARTYKAYIALFVCHSTSAVHLELVTDYTTDAFIAAYKRFTARRGICATLQSDCGTNLKGANSEMKKLFLSSTTELGRLSSLLANDGTQWMFNPPAAPHFGGKWEAGVKSVKHHLRRVIGENLLTYEEMYTLLTQIEAVLNSRPLCQLTEDPDDLTALTPGHFLIGGPLAVLPEPSLDNLQISRLSRWQLLRQMLESFWTKWSKECLQRYQTIYKWNQPTTEIQKGSMVLVIDERYPPSKWPLGRVLEVHPGNDGYIRVVTVKTQSSILRRPITKLSVLPINHNFL